MTAKGKYGGRVIGTREAARLQAEKKEGKNIYGSRVTGATSEGAEPPDKVGREGKRKEAAVAGFPSSIGVKPSDLQEKELEFSVNAAQEQLRENPAMLDRLIVAEQARPGPNRVTLLRDFLAAEHDKKGKARPDVVSFLERSIEELTS